MTMRMDGLKEQEIAGVSHPVGTLLRNMFSICCIVMGLASTLAGQSIDANTRWTRPAIVPGVVNDGTWNESPTITADGLTMFWESARELSSLELGEHEFCCIWSATRQSTDDAWENAQPLHTDLSEFDGQVLTDPEISADGLELFFMRNFDGPGQGSADELWSIRRSSVNEPFDIDSGGQLKRRYWWRRLSFESRFNWKWIGALLFSELQAETAAPVRPESWLRNARHSTLRSNRRSRCFRIRTRKSIGPVISFDGLTLLYGIKSQGSYISTRDSIDDPFALGEEISLAGLHGIEYSSDGKTRYHFWRGGVPVHPDWPFGPGESLWQSTAAEPCDLERRANGVCDVRDIDRLTREIRNGSDLPYLDLNHDGHIDLNDRNVWVHDLVNTFFGDSNLDGEFSSSDLTNVFQGW